MRPIKERFKTKGESHFFYDTKGDAKQLVEYCNMLADKINELNREVEELKMKLEGESCGFKYWKQCTIECKYFDTCTRNPYRKEEKK